MSDNKQAYIPSHALDSFAHVLYAERLAEIGTREPYLKIDLDLNKNKPQYSGVAVKVTHFIRGEERIKTFEVKTKLQYVKAALEQMREYAKKPFGGNRELTTWEIKANKIVNGQMTQEKVTAGKLVVGRTEKGPFISVVHWNDKYPHIAFFPGLHDPQAVNNPAGDDAERSYNFVCANTLGWATTMLDLLTTEYSRGINNILDNLRNQGGGGQGNNNNRGGGNYGGNNNRSYSSNSNEKTYDQNVNVSTSDNGDGFNF